MAVAAPRRELPPDLAALYPYEPRRVDADGVSLGVVDEGPRDSRETFVLLHGNPVWGFLYRRFVPRLVAAGHRVVVPDHAGCGRSDKPEDPRYYSLERHAQNLARALDAVDARDVTLVLHDWGGPIGLLWAVRRPERVRRIVVLNTTAFPPKSKRPLSAFHALFARRGVGEVAGRNLNLLLEVAIRFGVATRLPREVRRAYRWPFPTARSRTGILRFARMVPDGPAHPTTPILQEIVDGLPKLASVPALVVWGDRDPVFAPKFAERWRERLPGVRRVVHLPDASHFLQEDAPDAILDEMERFVSGA